MTTWCMYVLLVLLRNMFDKTFTNHNLEKSTSGDGCQQISSKTWYCSPKTGWTGCFVEETRGIWNSCWGKHVTMHGCANSCHVSWCYSGWVYVVSLDVMSVRKLEGVHTPEAMGIDSSKNEGLPNKFGFNHQIKNRWMTRNFCPSAVSLKCVCHEWICYVLFSSMELFLIWQGIWD